MEQHRAYGLAAAGVLAAAGCIEFVVAIAEPSWARNRVVHDDVSIVLSIFFLACAPAILMRDKSESWARTAFALAVTSTLALFTRSMLGLTILYLPLGLLQSFFVFQAFRGMRVDHHEPPMEPRIPMRWN